MQGSRVSDRRQQGSNSVEIAQTTIDGQIYYDMSQHKDLEEFLISKGLAAEEDRGAPIRDKRTLYEGKTATCNEHTWCKSVIGGLHFFSRMTRWDIAHAVSRTAQIGAAATAGTVRQLRDRWMLEGH